MEIKFKQSTKKEISLESQVGNVAECLMNAAKSLHKLHLKITGQGSYASHVALSGYDKFHDFADDLVEGIQGATGSLVTIPEQPCKQLNSVKDAISYLEEIKQEVTSLQSKLPYSEIVNQLDIVKEHCNGMKYKLTFLS